MNFFANCWKNLLQLSAGDAVLTNSKLEISDATSKDDISQAGSQLSFLTSAPYLYTPSCNSLITVLFHKTFSQYVLRSFSAMPVSNLSDHLNTLRHLRFPSPNSSETSCSAVFLTKLCSTAITIKYALPNTVINLALVSTGYDHSHGIYRQCSQVHASNSSSWSPILGLLHEHEWFPRSTTIEGFRPCSLTRSRYSCHLSVLSILLAKSGEKDERVPFINKLLRYAKEELLVKSIKEAELQICDFLDWHLQYGTGIDILEFYMVQGIFYANDISATTPKLSVDAKVLKEKPISSNFPPAVSQKNLPQSLQKPVAKQHSIFHKEVKENPIDVSFSTIDSELEVNKLTVEQVTKYEQDLITLVKDIVLDGFYLQFPNQNILASACIALHRKMIGATHFWYHCHDALS